MNRGKTIPKMITLRPLGEEGLRLLSKRLFEKTWPVGDCLEWLGAKAKDGYGRFRVGSRVLPASRVSLAIKLGRVNRGIDAGHTCGNRLCVLMAHLKPQTHAENMKEMYDNIN